VPLRTYANFVGIVTTQSVPELVPESSTNSFMMWSCISTALTGSAVDAAHSEL
jgi:hypothetical protein